MKKRWAVLIILGALLLGIMSPRVVVAGGRLTRSMRTMISCMLLGEAEKAGYLDKAKRAVWSTISPMPGPSTPAPADPRQH